MKKTEAKAMAMAGSLAGYLDRNALHYQTIFLSFFLSYLQLSVQLFSF